MTTQLVVGVFSPSVLLRVASDSGILASHGLSVDQVAATSSPAQFRDLLDGMLDAVLTSPDNVVAYRYVPDNPLRTLADVTMVSAIDRGLGLSLYGAPGRHTISELEGAVIGVDVATSGFAFAMYELAATSGLLRSNYIVAELGSTPQRLQALLKGQCDATMLNAGNELVAEESGCINLGRLTNFVNPYIGTVLACTEQRLSHDIWDLRVALSDTAAQIVANNLDDYALRAASDALALSRNSARRYVHKLKDPREGLVPSGIVDRESLTNVVNLRQRHLPAFHGGIDQLASALADDTPIIATSAQFP